MTTLESALEQLLAIQALPLGYRDPQRIDPDLPQLTEPWIPLPEDLIVAVKSELFRLNDEGLPLPSFLQPIAPYLGNGGVAIYWRDPHVSIGAAPQVVLTVTMVAGTSVIAFEDEIYEREHDVPGYGAASVAQAHDFLSEALTRWNARRLRPN